MTETPFADAALRYAELGYRVFPCCPGRKEPATARGCLDAADDAARVERRAADGPAYNVGIATAGLLVVDVDGADNPWPGPERAMDLLAAPQQRTPRGGRHYFFRPAAGVRYRNSAGRVAPNVDVRGDGGDVLAAPSRVGDAAYAWTPGLALEVRPEDLPKPPAWLADQLAEPLPLDDADESEGIIPPGQRNDTLARVGGNVRRTGAGVNEIRALLRETNRQRCRPPLADAEVDRIASSVARYAPDVVWAAIVNGGLQDDPDEPLPAEDVPVDPGRFPAHLLDVPGLLGDVTRFMLDGAIKPQPELALAGAVALLGTIAGRKVADPYGTRTKLYVVGVAPSGSGKERARTAVKAILGTAGMLDLLGPEAIASEAGLRRAVEKHPAILLPIDEVGWFLATTNNVGRSPHLAAARALLLKLYSSSGTTFCGTAYADDDKTKPIHCPHLCVYGTTVPGPLFDAIGEGGMSDGLGSRLLIVTGDPAPKRQKPNLYPPPEGLVAAVRAWGDYKPGGGNLADLDPEAHVVPYAADAERLMEAFDARVDALLDETPDEARRGPWVRCGENARKLALVHACSEFGPDPERLTVGVAAVLWGTAVAEHLARQFTSAAHDKMASNDFERDRKKVREFIKAAGKVGCTLTQVKRKFQRLKPKELAEALEAEIACGFIRKQEVSTAGRPATVFRCV